MKDIRPWGNWQLLDEGEGYKVKRIDVKPGQRLSLQYHERRSEHWVVVAGRGRVTIGEETLEVEPGRRLFIPKRGPHRIENIGQEIFKVIEVQLGEYLGEDDIVRIQDDYGRIKQ
jgi:mannose-1-phosphate guanylyltransferase/mannose-6-phosphate isomerase